MQKLLKNLFFGLLTNARDKHNPTTFWLLSLILLSVSAPYGQTVQADQESFNLCQELTRFSATHGEGLELHEIDLDQAKLACNNALITNENNADVYFSLGRISDAEQDFEASFNYFLKSADLGSGDAAAELAFAYMEGYGTEQSNEKLVEWARVAHQRGSAQGAHWLGIAYRDGLGVISNAEKALSYLEIASSRGSSSANIVLGVSYADGQMGLESNLAKAEKYWLIERLRNNDEALVDQYTHLLHYPRSPNEMASAIIELKVAANQGWDQAATVLSWVNTWPETYDYTETEQVSELLSPESGFKYAMDAIASTYFLENIGFYIRPKIAEKLTDEQAKLFQEKLIEISRSEQPNKNNSIIATMTLAGFEYDGIFAPANLQREISHLEFAAVNLRYLPAANSLSYTYREDPAVRDVSKALEFAELATGATNPFDQAVGYSSIGVIYAYSEELRDFKKAKYYFEKAIKILELSEYAHDEAFVHLARILILGGHGIQRDIPAAKAVIAILEQWSEEDFYGYFLNRFTFPDGATEAQIIEDLLLVFEEGRNESASELAAFYELLGDAEQQYKWTFVCSIVCKDPLRSYSADYMELKAKGIRGDQIDTARTEAIQIVTNQIAKSSIPSGSVPSLVKSRKSYKAGRLRAVLIGNTSYDNFVDLETPIRDIRAIGNLLTEKYQASVRYVENGTRAEIIKELAELSSYAKPNDRVLIYFAGHGELVNKEEEGYWLPTDADADIDTNWISNSYVKRKVRSLAADNVLIVADTCFSGAMTRGISLREDAASPDAIQKFLDTKSRIVISSGGLKPVLDGFGGEYSIFANEFVQALENTDDPFTASGLYQKLRDSVTQKSLALGMEQVPLMSNLIAEGHEGPDFVLLPN